jgi:hypothetical protein
LQLFYQVTLSLLSKELSNRNLESGVEIKRTSLQKPIVQFPYTELAQNYRFALLFVAMTNNTGEA